MGHKLTENDIKKMQEEIDHRILVVRKEALEDVKTARAQGDLSENFEYYAAKKFKNQNESRIRYLEKMIKNAEVISDESSEDEIGVNNTVVIRYDGEDEEETVKLVTTVRGDMLLGNVSIESPLGKALLGKKAGDRVHVDVDSNVSFDVEIISFTNTDDSTDSIMKY